MNEKINKLKRLTLFLTLIEIVLVGAFLTLYLLNIWNLYELVKVEYLVYVFFGFVFIDCVYIWFILSKINKSRQLSDIRTSEIIGSDIKEAYLFGKLAFVVCDEKGIVLWESDLLLQRQINIVNLNIYEWCPKLKDFLEKDIGNTLKITQDGVQYEVEYLRSAGLFLFKDVSEYETLSRYAKDQATCIGLITIDNYVDVMGNGGDDNNDVITKVRNEIYNYAKIFNVVIRHIRNDAYFAVCNFSSLDKMKKDGFSLLDDVRQVGAHEQIRPTLSIGFAHDFPDVNKLNDMASNAIDIAMSRGGDQAVISKYGSELEFYGGKSEAIEKRNKVKVRVVGDSLIGLIGRSSNIIIMGHTMADMDAIGACLGIKAICDYCKKPSVVVYEPKFFERKARAAMTSLFNREQLQKITANCKDVFGLVSATTLIIVVDVSKPSMTICPKILEDSPKVVVIDHHRRAEDFIDNPVLSYIEPGASSSCELIAELIKYNSVANANGGIQLDSIFATIMLSGIFLDTGFYKNKSVGIRTFDASLILKEYGADNGIADDLLKDEYEEYVLINKIISTMQTPYYGIVYCMAEEDEILEASTLAKVGNQCMQLKGINACFVIGRTSDSEVRISARSDGTVNVQIICEKLDGGGHLSQAAALLKKTTISEVKDKLLDVLGTYLSDARTSIKKGE